MSDSICVTRTTGRIFGKRGHLQSKRKTRPSKKTTKQNKNNLPLLSSNFRADIFNIFQLESGFDFTQTIMHSVNCNLPNCYRLHIRELKCWQLARKKAMPAKKEDDPIQTEKSSVVLLSLEGVFSEIEKFPNILLQLRKPQDLLHTHYLEARRALKYTTTYPL